RNSTAALLFGFERIYWLFAICCGVVTFLLAGVISRNWIQLGDLSTMDGQIAVCGAAAIFAVQFPGSVYRSLMVGTQEQVKLNGIMTGGALLRHIGGIFVVFIRPELSTYLIWQASVALLETLVRGRLAWRILGINRRQMLWQRDALRPVWRFMAGMTAAVLMVALTVQMDRIVLSRMVSMEQFGFYTLAASISMGVLQLAYPVYQAVAPQMVQLREHSEALYRFNLRLFFGVGLMFFGILAGFIMMGRWLLHVWLRSPEAVEFVYPVTVILLIGTCLNVLYNVGYINWISHGETRRICVVNAIALGLAVILVPVFVVWKGSVGAAIGWPIINSIGVVLSLDWVRKRKQISG
ncbi:MAG: oligosaccharide flippase family protein, partial [Kiritimatiellales bacterium]